jgi:hypothetical protein
MSGWLTDVGPLRLMLALLVLLVVLMAPAALGEMRLDWPMVVPTVVAPAVAPILFFVLMLDVLMTRVWMSSADEAGRARLRRAFRFDLAVTAVLVAAWTPFFLRLAGAL